MIVETRCYKGGTGKSTILNFIIDNFRDTGEPLTVLDTDGCNPDIARVHKHLASDDFKLVNFPLNCTRDYIRFFKEICAAHEEDRTLIVNHGTNNYDEARAYGKGLGKICVRKGIDYRTMWVVDADPFCVSQVKDFLETTKWYPKITIIKNLGKDSKIALDRAVPSQYPQTFFPEFDHIFTQYLKCDQKVPVSELEQVMEFEEWCLFEDYVGQGKEAAKQAVEMARQIPKD